eukprot:CAMPEP_0203750706 /NCGR_PEP_ID=MMETSP0098-20131031/4900_1 /ASSEMBLY_ACC=CAM_ASM_000208 /TAXON_ID=96639 /ORGANISM=" , Strain NY0313808BC1" /LENGTH=181 /DNA_ID=CAMNT_0050640123 /DNA_START=358 /DNA_END=903 /DNA_ORIENTATION=+
MSLQSPNTNTNVDIEDVVQELQDVEELLSLADLADATPKLLVVSDEIPEDVVTRERADTLEPELVCENCLRSDCKTVQPTVGFYTWRQVRSHCSPDDCWIVSHGFVYDVTRYLKKHPGGARSILARAGGDASADFDFHTKLAKRKLWPRFKVGRIAVCKNPHAVAPPNETAFEGEEGCHIM